MKNHLLPLSILYLLRRWRSSETATSGPISGGNDIEKGSKMNGLPYKTGFFRSKMQNGVYILQVKDHTGYSAYSKISIVH